MKILLLLLPLLLVLLLPTSALAQEPYPAPTETATFTPTATLTPTSTLTPTATLVPTPGITPVAVVSDTVGLHLSDVLSVSQQLAREQEHAWRLDGAYGGVPAGLGVWTAMLGILGIITALLSNVVRTWHDDDD
jgi:hypothetical protein